MSTAETFLAEALPPQEAGPPTDQYDRYVLPDPETGEIVSWTRATTFAGTVADERRFDRWRERLTAVGLSQRQDLVAGIAAVRDPDSKAGKAAISKICEAAQEHGGRTTRANIGTALHAYLASIDEGYDVAIPEQWQPDVEAYYTELVRTGIVVSENFIERICIVPGYRVAGTMDRLAKFNNRNGKPFVLDVKTGADLRYYWNEYAIQLALYAHSTHCWRDGRLYEMPEVQHDIAVIVHVPAGEGTAMAYYVDIKAAWEMVAVCSAVREWRKRKDLAYPVLPKEGS